MLSGQWASRARHDGERLELRDHRPDREEGRRPDLGGAQGEGQEDEGGRDRQDVQDEAREHLSAHDREGDLVRVVQAEGRPERGHVHEVDHRVVQVRVRLLV